ncbi:MAG: ATP-binding protein [Bryobacteraceae bacterium]
MSNNRVNAIHEAADGSLWIGTQNGLDHFFPATKQFTHFSQRQGLGGSLVSCILEDDSHQLWMSTNAGISHLDPGSGQFRTFGTADGLPGQDMSGWGTCLQARSGEMFFAGFAGAAAFFPKEVGTDPYVPPVVFTDLLLQRPSASPQEIPVINRTEVTLDPWQNDFSIGFTALSLSHPIANRYRYRMPGRQDGWTEVSSDKRRATFLGLSPGLYTIQVQGATGQGAWSEPGALLRINVLPPWWGTWTFRAGVLALIGLMLLLVYRARIARIHREYQARFEERADERARIARELHDTLLQGFQGLMFRLQAVRDLLPARPERAIPVLETALERGENAIDEARHAVNGLRSSTALEADLEHIFSSLAADIANEEHTPDAPSVAIAVSGGVRPVRSPALHDLRQIAQEVLRNAFRHARAKRIDVRVAYRKDALVLSFRDDGVGIEESIIAAGQRPGHWGLPGMRERTAKVGGTLTLTSQPGRGTDVTVSLPAAAAYERSALR